MNKDEVKELIKESAEMANSVYKGVTCSGEQALDYFKAVLECNVEALFEDEAKEDQDTRDLGIHSNPDALVWAKYFCKHNSAADEGTMLAWFANAMMAMHDHIHQNNHVIPKCKCNV